MDKLIKADFLSKEELDELKYGSARDKENIRKVLLLYNIITMLGDSQDTILVDSQENSYFPFDIYKNEKWDIEHIASVKGSLPAKKYRKNCLTDVKSFIDTPQPDAGKAETLKSKLETYLKSEPKKDKGFLDDEQFTELFEEIVEHFNPGSNENGSDHISNLTLLDSGTNRGYKNAVFPVKRKTIIDRDKKGRFIPLCTKNVFLKYYSENSTHIFFWTQNDRNQYKDDIEKVLKRYINNE